MALYTSLLWSREVPTYCIVVVKMDSFNMLVKYYSTLYVEAPLYAIHQLLYVLFLLQFDLRSSSATKLFCCSSSTGNKKQPPSKVGLNSIVIDSRKPYYFAIGGSDEYARIYDIRKCQWDAARNSDRPVNTFCPHHLVGSNVHITGLAYSRLSELLVTYNDELIYLFEKNVGLGSSPSSATSEDPKNLHEARVYSGHRNAQTVKGVNFFGPNDEYVLSGSDCGHIFIWKKKDAKLVRLMVGDQHVVNQLETHPHIPFLATCGIEKNVKIWAPLGSDIPPLPANVKEVPSAVFTFSLILFPFHKCLVYFQRKCIMLLFWAIRYV